jgi:hypothetical protein
MKIYKSHIDQKIKAMRGRSLIFGPQENIDGTFPSTVTSITEWHDQEDIQGTFDTILSIENLSSRENIYELLQLLLSYTHEDTRLLFCEQTATPDTRSNRRRHDITGVLWDSGWSVIDCGRDAIGKGKRASNYVYGIARPKRFPNQ